MGLGFCIVHLKKPDWVGRRHGIILLKQHYKVDASLCHAVQRDGASTFPRRPPLTVPAIGALLLR